MEVRKEDNMNESILMTIKKMLGLDVNYDAFDTDIIVFINSAMMTLQQIGVGPVNGLTVTGANERWSDFLPSDKMMEGVKTYIYLSVKMVFDPPASSFVMDAMKQQKEELEWRLREQAEFFPGDGSTKGYWEGKDDETIPEGAVIYNGKPPDVRYPDGGFRAHGGWYASDPDFPWKDGPSQPAIVEPDGEQG
jgi:hypothetical protein